MSRGAAGKAIPPGATIGILGGGQLGRMTALAAASLGYRCHIFCQSPDAPAAQAAAQTTLARFDDAAALESFAEAVDVATPEFENVPIEALERLSERIPVRPAPAVQAVAQNRLREKAFANALGIATAPFRAVADAAALAGAIAEIGAPCILKTVRLGYDGKGQVAVGPDTDPQDAWSASGAGAATGGAVLEGFVEFEQEISVIAARNAAGDVAAYAPVGNRHRERILAETVVPAPVSADVAAAAGDIAVRLCEGLDVVGLLAVEMFVAPGGSVLVNEIAPRPHNSGHWTIDAARTSQFEQLVRAICGLPLGDPARRCDAVMTNLIGDDIERWRDHLADPAARIHIYGKTETRPGRKMGHVTRLGTPRDS